MAYANKYFAGWGSPDNLKGYLYIDQLGLTDTDAVIDVDLSLLTDEVYPYETGTLKEPFLIQVLDENNSELRWFTYLEGGTWKIGIPPTGTAQTITLKILYVDDFTFTITTNPTYVNTPINLLNGIDYIYNTNSATRPFMTNLVDSDGYSLPIQLYLDTTWKIKIIGSSPSRTVYLRLIYPLWFTTLTNGTADIDMVDMADTGFVYDTGSTEKPFIYQVVGDDGYLLIPTLYLDTTWKLSMDLSVSTIAMLSIIHSISLDGESGGVGAITELKLRADGGLKLVYSFGDWNNPIIGMQMEFSIQNDKTDFYELLPLMISQEKQYKIRCVAFHPTSYTIFEGFLNCDTVTQKYLHYQPINFVASSFLNKLEGFHPASIDILQNMTFINIIDELLRSTGAYFDIRVNCKIHAEGDVLSTGQTLFNKNGFYTELFWDDAVNRTSSLDILKKILIAFDCYIYWWRGYWYIERYEDIWSDEVDFVNYTTGVLYSPTSTGSVVHAVQTIADVHTLVHTGQSQTLHVIPGLKTIKVNLEDKRIFNLVLDHLDNVLEVTSGVPEPSYRDFLMWREYSLHWSQQGMTKASIKNSIFRLITEGTIIPSYRGLFTTFRVTVVDENVQLTVKFKYCIDAPRIIDGWTKKWKDYSFDFNWTLRIAGTNYYIVNSGEDWVTEIGLSNGEVENQIQTTTVGGSSFDPVSNCVDVSISVPVGLVRTYFDGLDSGPLKGDQTLVFCIGMERIHIPEETETTGTQISECWLGDVEVSTSGGVQNNVITAKVNDSGFLNTKEIGMTLYDMESYNYKNGVLRGDTLSIRTERWGTTEGATNISAKGVCWSTSHDPTITDAKTNDGTGFDPFTSLMTGLLPGTVYYVRSYATTSLGTTYGQEETFTTNNLQLGSYHQGGIVFYFLEDGDEGYDPLVRKGLIVSIKDVHPGMFWMSLARPIPPMPLAYGMAIGTGSDNTALMAANTTAARYAVKYVLDYANDGYTDWYMPSISELMKLRLNKSYVAGLQANWYWSSSEVDPSVDFFEDILGVKDRKFAWALNFKNTSNPETWQKNNYMGVRAIRSFVES